MTGISTFEGAVRGPQINTAGTGNASGFTLVKAPKPFEEETEEVKTSQEEFRILQPTF